MESEHMLTPRQNPLYWRMRGSNPWCCIMQDIESNTYQLSYSGPHMLLNLALNTSNQLRFQTAEAVFYCTSAVQHYHLLLYLLNLLCTCGFAAFAHIRDWVLLHFLIILTVSPFLKAYFVFFWIGKTFFDRTARGCSLKPGSTELTSMFVRVIQIVEHLSFNRHLSAKIKVLWNTHPSSGD